MKAFLALGSFLIGLFCAGLIAMGWSDHVDLIKVAALVFGAVVFGIIFPFTLLTSRK